MTFDFGPNTYLWLTESRPWMFWGFVIFLWAKIGIAIVLRPARGIRRGE